VVSYVVTARLTPLPEPAEPEPERSQVVGDAGASARAQARVE
jgi:hypothetical protein